MRRLATAEPRERGDVLRIAAARHGLAPALIEKDFWVCWTLERLFALPDVAPHLLFKGGTTLSKVYGVIERFSEDVDVSISRDFVRPGAAQAAEADGISNTRRRKEIETLVALFHRAVGEVVLPRLHGAFAQELGTDAGWQLVQDAGDPGTLLFAYPPGVGQAPAHARGTDPETGPEIGAVYNAPRVKIEMGGRSDVWPEEAGTIKPYAAQAVPEAFESPEVSVRVLAAERTFWEKATLLHNEYHRPAEKRRGERISRHYYDLAQLAAHPQIGPRSLAARDVLERVVEHKSIYYRDAWSRYAEAATGAMRLVPPEGEQRARLRGDYRQMRPMFFGEPPAFDDLLATLGELEERINGTG